MPELHAQLGLEVGADAVQIQRAFRQRARAAHPDHDPSPGATGRMRRLIEARDLLLRRLERKRAVDFGEFLERIVRPSLGRPNPELGRVLAGLINRDPDAEIRVTGMS